jgi:hypothetical protein
VLARAQRAAPGWETRLGAAAPVLGVSTLWPPLAAAAAASTLLWLEPVAEPHDLPSPSTSHQPGARVISDESEPSLSALVEELRAAAPAFQPLDGRRSPSREPAGAGTMARAESPRPSTADDDPDGTATLPTGAPLPAHRLPAVEAGADLPATRSSPSGAGGDGAGVESPGEANPPAPAEGHAPVPEEMRTISRRGNAEGSGHDMGMPVTAQIAALPPAMVRTAAPAEAPEGMLPAGQAHGPERRRLLDRFFEILRQDHDHQ